MLDLHCHLLPAIDDGAPDLDTALEMARIAWEDGIRTVACTPHIYPGMYENTSQSITDAMTALRAHLDREGIALELVIGADVHLDPGVPQGLRDGRIPTLAGSRYVLLEPPHHVAPPRFDDSVFELMVAGYVPVITHPERLSWIEDHYDMFRRLSERGVWLQVTGGALTGRFGRRPQYWGERLVDEGLCAVLATDAHETRRRPPRLAEARDAVARRVGEDEATHMVQTRPAGVVANVAPDALPPVLAQRGGGARPSRTAGWRRWFGRT